MDYLFNGLLAWFALWIVSAIAGISVASWCFWKLWRLIHNSEEKYHE